MKIISELSVGLGLCLLLTTNCHAETAPARTRPWNAERVAKVFAQHPDFISDGFDFPAGKPDARGYYNAQGFRVRNRRFGGNFHLGEDWNARTGGNTDLGAPVYAVANGVVVHTRDHGGGWGPVLRVVHKLPPGSKYPYVESLYAHLREYSKRPGDLVKRGERIGSIGNLDGLYNAHLHLELRFRIFAPLGGGYAPETPDHLDPTKFIKENRPASPEGAPATRDNR